MTDEMIKSIAEWLVDYGFSRTLEGNYHIGFDEVARHFKCDILDVVMHRQDIADIINADDRVLSETWIDYDFDMNFITPEEDENFEVQTVHLKDDDFYEAKNVATFNCPYCDKETSVEEFDEFTYCENCRKRIAIKVGE